MLIICSGVDGIDVIGPWMASKLNFGKRLRVTGHEYRKMDYGAALGCGCSCENRFVS